MSKVPTWLLGRYVTAITATVVTSIASDGTITLGSQAQSFTGLLNKISRRSTNKTTTFEPMDTRQDADMIEGSRTEITLTEIMNQQGTGNVASAQLPGNILSAIYDAADYVQVTFTRGAKTFTGIFVVGDFSEEMVRGQCNATLDLKPAGTGYTNS